MYRIKNCFCILILLISNSLYSQIRAQSQMISLNSDILESYYKIIFNDSLLHPVIRQYRYSDLNNFCPIDSQLAPRHSKLLNKLAKDNFVRYSYKSSVGGISFAPIVGIAIKNDFVSNKFLQQYDLGISLSAYYKKQLFFDFNMAISENQFLSIIDNQTYNYIDSTGIVPHYGKVLYQQNDSYYFLKTKAILSYAPNETFDFRIGYDRHFIGDGYRSLLLSDNSNAYPFAAISVNIWRLKYMLLYMKLTDIELPAEDEMTVFNKLSTQYAVSHIISWNTTNWSNIYLFETVTWNAYDSIGYRGFDVNYLNPFIFFRPVEFSLGSPDNVLLGFGFRVRLARNYHFYSQFLIDELVLSELDAANGWWGNKFGIQSGIRSFDVGGIKNFNLLLEYNYVRPYTYSHQNTLQNYGHYYQPLAHPLGANFREFVMFSSYRMSRLAFYGKFLFANFGTDIDQLNFGHNIYKPYTTRQTYNSNVDYGHKTGQGIENRLLCAELRAGYLLNTKIHLQLELGIQYRKHEIEAVSQKAIVLCFAVKSLIFNDLFDY